MIPATDLCPPHLRRLNQGDVFPGVAFTIAELKLQTVQRRTVEDLSVGYFPADESNIVLTGTVTAEGIVLSYDCEIDRVLRRIKNSRPHQYSDVATVAAVYPIDEFGPPEQHQIRLENSPRYVILENSEIYAERVIDFSSIQPIPLARLLRTARTRSHGLTDAGRVALITAFAYHLGDDARVAAAGQPDDELLEAALSSLSI